MKTNNNKAKKAKPKYTNIIRADIDEESKVVIGMTVNMFVCNPPNNESTATEWGKLLAQMLKAVAKNLATHGLNEEVAETRVLRAMQEALFSVDEPKINPSEPIPGDMD